MGQATSLLRHCGPWCTWATFVRRTRHKSTVTGPTDIIGFVGDRVPPTAACVAGRADAASNPTEQPEALWPFSGVAAGSMLAMTHAGRHGAAASPSSGLAVRRARRDVDSGFDRRRWEAIRYGIVLVGSIARFAQYAEQGWFRRTPATGFHRGPASIDRMWGIGSGSR